VLKIHTSDGQTHRVDLTDENQACFWMDKLSREDFQATVNGISLVEYHSIGKCQNCGCNFDKSIGVQYSIPRPYGFKKNFFTAELIEPNGTVKGGEKVTLFSDNIRIVLMAHKSQPATRISVTKIGNHKYNPLQRNKNNGRGLSEYNY